MVEFGEKVKRAREAKGMTQQTLANHLYVTRQAVSRWECGSRYPDLLTAKKIALFLEVSLDELLSGDEMQRIAEKRPVIENPGMKKILLILYGFIAFSFLITAADVILRFPFAVNAGNLATLQLLLLGFAALLTQTVIFGYGFIMEMKDVLTPAKTGGILSVYFLTLCLTNAQHITAGIGYTGWRSIVMEIVVTFPALLGAIAAYRFFCCKKRQRFWHICIDVVSIWGILNIIYTTWSISRYSSEFASMNTTVNMLLKICVYILILYQVHVLRKKRENRKSLVD